MRTSLLGTIALIAAMGFSPVVFGQTSAKPATAKSFDPHDLSGVWREVGPAPGKGRDSATQPEPPLTAWAKENLVPKRGISHALLGGAQDPTGAIQNNPDGEYPGQACETIAAPGQYSYLNLYPFEFVMTPDRIFQMFEYHREWRTFWLNREHPKDLDPSYMGDSTARWDGNTLVVDTIGFNGKDFVSVDIGNRMSDAFRLVERFQRIDHDHLQMEMTYYDPKAWGDKAWAGFKRVFTLKPEDDFEEFICSPQEYREYDQDITNDLLKNSKK